MEGVENNRENLITCALLAYRKLTRNLRLPKRDDTVEKYWFRRQETSQYRVSIRSRLNAS